MPNNLVSVVSINSTSFVTLNNKGFEKMLISNTGTTDLDFNLVYGDTRLVGETSVGSTYESFFFLKSIEIPVGTTLELDGYSPVSIQKTDGTVLRKSRTVTSERDGQNKNFKKLSKTTTIVDYSFLVSLDNGSDTADVVVIYKDNLANY